MRGFAGLGLAAAAWPLAAGCDRSAPAARDASPAARVHRVGWLASWDGELLRDSSPLSWLLGPPGPALQRFLDRLTELGYAEGRNLHWEFRRAPAGDPLAAAAAELVGLGVELILSFGDGWATRAAFEAAGNTPVVAVLRNPVGDGYAQSLAHPGGKVTGVIYVPPAFGLKWLELLKDVLPTLARVGVLFDGGNESMMTKETSLASLGPPARELGIELVYEEVRTLEEVEGAVAALASAGVQVVYPSTRASWTGPAMVARLSQEALRHRLPILGLNRDSVKAGALVGYGPDPGAIWSRTADYVDKVLRGARPADLPIEQPTTFELTLNLRIARELGLTIPPSALARATEVFQ
jgi:putative ABC transport system substrate-binding protein